ncbi:PREDICTED: odorant receptor 49b-like [Vollenhovia emeryi]|uniref:odorant receptor 49b-like n=1 Tax=Vollenhovia emeryi TaxID=411798 RepID=UPI0005F43DB2|nr:PREDICTED: odorant receptor 49b-like [Vollenhovia emeryi]
MLTDKLMRHADFEWATKPNRIVLNIFGLWPNVRENPRDRFFSNLRVIFTFVIFVFTGVTPAIHSVVRIWGDLMSMIDNLQTILPCIMTIIGLVVIWWKKPDLLLAISMIAEDWIKIKSDKERCIMIKHAQYARILTLIGYSYMFLSACLLVLLPFFGKSVRYMTNVTDPDKILPLQSHYIYDKNQSPYFEFSYFTQSLMVVMCTACYSSMDNLFGLLVFHLCGQLENLKDKLINKNIYENDNKTVAFIVKEHIRLIEYVHIIENIFTLLLLGFFVYIGLLCSLYGFLIIAILKEGKKMSIMRFIYITSVAINVSGHMCLLCAVSELLVAKSESIYHAAYEHEWYKLKPEKAKCLLLIMVRAKKPFYIMAGKIIPMTLSTFCNLIKTSASYVSVLIAIQN